MSMALKFQLYLVTVILPFEIYLFQQNLVLQIHIYVVAIFDS